MLLISEEVLLKKECAAQVSRGVTKRTIALEKQQQEKIDSLAIFCLFVLSEIIRGEEMDWAILFLLAWKLLSFYVELFDVPEICESWGLLLSLCGKQTLLVRPFTCSVWAVVLAQWAHITFTKGVIQPCPRVTPGRKEGVCLILPPPLV